MAWNEAQANSAPVGDLVVEINDSDEDTFIKKTLKEMFNERLKHNKNKQQQKQTKHEGNKHVTFTKNVFYND